MKIAVILPAAGLSTRFGNSTGGSTSGGGALEDDAQLLGAEKSKIEQDLAGRPVFMRAIEVFLNRDEVSQVIMAVNPDRVDGFKLKWGDKLGINGVSIVAGGKTERWQTVLQALKSVDEQCTHVAIHDAARPLVSAEMVSRVFEAAKTFDAVIPGVAISSTIKKVVIDEGAADMVEGDPLDAILGDAGKVMNDDIKKVVETVDRHQMVEVQTPQVFEISLLKRAYDLVESGKISGDSITDDACLVEHLGEPVRVVDGESSNIKITRPEDLRIVRAMISKDARKDAAFLAKKRLFGGSK